MHRTVLVRPRKTQSLAVESLGIRRSSKTQCDIDERIDVKLIHEFICVVSLATCLLCSTSVFGQLSTVAKTDRRVEGHRANKAAAVCSAAKAEHLEPVSFDHMHGLLSYNAGGTSPWSGYYIAKGMAQADLNNDGISDNLVQLIYESSSERQCNAIRLAYLDESRSMLLNDSSQRTFDQTEHGCNVDGPIDKSLNIWKYKGTVYIEQIQKGRKKLFHISPHGTEIICDLKIRTLSTTKTRPISKPQ